MKRITKDPQKIIGRPQCYLSKDTPVGKSRPSAQIMVSSPIPPKGNKALEKWVIPELGQGRVKVIPEYFTVPENRKCPQK